MSSFVSWRGGCFRKRGASTAATTPKGTLMNSTQRQETASVSTPPRIRPTPKPAEDMPANSESARTRALVSVKVLLSSAIALGPAMAAPTPWTTRAASSSTPVVARPPASEARVKIRMPAVNRRRRPNRSPSRPPSSSRPPKVNV